MPYKDNLITQLAEELNSRIRAIAIVGENIKPAVHQGWGEENASALIKALEMEAGVTLAQQ